MTTGPGRSADPDEPPEETSDPAAIDAAFNQIVAHINHPDTAASTAPWPEVESPQDPPDDAGPAPSVPSRAPRSDWTGWDDLRPPTEPPGPIEPVDADDEGHYLPPPPPPVPTGDRVTRWAWAGAVGAPVLAILLPLVGWAIDGLIGALLVAAFLAGFVTLISRLRTGPPIDDGPDDGAVV